jgi:hypothetical protein
MLTLLISILIVRWIYQQWSWRCTRLVLASMVFFFVGCGQMGRLPQTTLSIPSIPLNPQTRLSNPINVNTQDSEFLWNQIVDTVEDYFRIKYEQRPTRDATQWVEGRMETYPEVGATYLEPWRKDALEGYQRWQSTLQTMRRTCNIRVIPTNEGFSIAVEVIKELEDVDRSQYSSEGSAIARHDGSVVRSDAQLLGQPITLGWIRQENDADLEQRIIREILGRVSNVRVPRRKLLGP